MTRSQRNNRFAGLALLLALIFLGTVLSGAGYGETLKFVFMADCRGFGPNEPIDLKVLKEINDKILALSPRPAFVLFGGDLALTGLKADGKSNNFQAFKDAMKPITDAGIKLYVALGNHELYKEGNHGNFYREAQEQYRQAFADLPGNGPPGYERLVYSFESDGHDAFFAVLDPYYMDPDSSVRQPVNHAVGSFDAKQLEWLTKQLKQTKATHKFLCSHVPIHQVTRDQTDSSYFDLWSIMDQARFDIYFCGHVHLFSRKAIDRGVDPRWQNSVVQLLTGDGGAPAVEAAAVVRDSRDWHIDVGSNYYSVVELNGSQVAVDSYGGRDGNYKVIDHFTLTAGSAGQPAKPEARQVPIAR